MEQVALSWIILDMTDSVFAVSALFGVRSLPNLIVSPFAGVLADRLERRSMLVGTQVVSIVTSCIFVFLSLSDSLELWHIYMLVITWGAAFAMANPARQSLIPALVPREDLMNSIALNSIGFNISRALGPTIGGLLLAFAGFTTVYVVLIFVYSAVFLCALSIRIRSEASPEVRAERPLQTFKNGLSYIKGDQTMRGLVLLALIPIAIGLPYVSLLPVIAKETLGVDEFGFGLLMTSAGIGALAAGLALASATHFRRGGALLIMIGLLFGVSVIVLGLSTVYVVAFVANLLAGGFSMCYFSLNNVLVQTNVQERMRGRISSVLMMEFGITPAGAFLAGGIAEFTSPGATVAGMGVLLTTLAATAFFKMRHMHYVGTALKNEQPAPS